MVYLVYSSDSDYDVNSPQKIEADSIYAAIAKFCKAMNWPPGDYTVLVTNSVTKETAKYGVRAETVYRWALDRRP
jgi:hypothetical protein